MRFGLCCKWNTVDIKFKTTTVKKISSLKDRIDFLENIISENVRSLSNSLKKCKELEIGCFRVGSDFLPVVTHPEFGYSLKDFKKDFSSELRSIGRFAKENGIRIVTHPSQYIVLNSPKKEVLDASIKDLEYHAELMDLLGGDVIILHVGGAYGDKEKASLDFIQNFELLSDSVKQKLCVENDDKTFSADFVLRISDKLKIPFIFDVHHHRCNHCDDTISSITEKCFRTWGDREPLFHISSPKDGWNNRKEANKHSDYIDINDFPDEWFGMNVTVEVEAKAKEDAVLKLRKEYEEKLIHV